MDLPKITTGEPPKGRGRKPKQTDYNAGRGEKNLIDQGIVTTVMRAAEQLAAPLSPPAKHVPQEYATPEDYDESVLPRDNARLLALCGEIRSLLASDPQLATQAANAREAFGDGETLRILFRRLFPQQREGSIYRNPDGSPVLSPREVEVLKEAAKDLGHEEIARRLDVTPRTVSTHLSHIYAKLHVQRPMQAVARAISMGYLDTDVLGFIAGAASTASRNFRLFDTLASAPASIDHAPYDRVLRPLADFGLLLLLLAGSAAAETDGNQRRWDEAAPAEVCELDATGRVIRHFGGERLRGGCRIVIAPPAAARHGYKPGHLFILSQQVPGVGMNMDVINEFTPAGRFIRSFSGGNEIGSRLGYGRLAFDVQGRLLVSSGAMTDSLLIFRRGGRSVRRFADCIAGAVCVTPDRTGQVYVTHASSVGHHIRVYDAAGRLLRTFGQTPPEIGYECIAVDSRGHIWAIRSADLKRRFEFALVEFGPDGSERRTRAVAGLGRALLTVDGEDRVYAPCPHTGDIKVLSPNGRLLRRIDLRGRIIPFAIAIGESGNVWVTGNTI